MASYLSNLVNNLFEGIHKINANTKMMIKGVQFSEINISIATSFPEYTNFKDDLIEHKFLCCKKNYQ